MAAANKESFVPRDKGLGLLWMAFGALGIIYGDIGTSPLYAYQSVFSSAGTPPAPNEVLAAASLFFWTITLFVLIKYVGIILRFDDNGEGGTFALYSLMCRAGGFTPFGPAHPEELQLSGGMLGLLPHWMTRGHWWSLTNAKSQPLRKAYMRSRGLQVSLLFVVMTATAMVMGDGVLTPSISVLSAVSGLKVAVPSLQQSQVAGIAIAVLVLLFSVQYLGTAKISAAFSPIVIIWLVTNAAMGFVNLNKFGWGIWKALSPHYGISAFMGPGGFAAGWTLLAGVMLAITGAEAMYSDLGHFNARAVALSFCGLVYPCLIVTYMGQAAYVTANPDAYTDPFWNSVPQGAFWFVLIVATSTSVVASQALISAVFSIVRQAMNLGAFPPMKVVHTASAHEGQIYIGPVNYVLMLCCVAVVAGFQDTTALGHAYGVTVMAVMCLTTILASLVMLVCYGINPLIVAAFLIFYVPLDFLFLSSNVTKIPEGGWVALVLAAVVAAINIVWWYGSAAKSRWYKAQAERNKGLLAHLPLADLEGADGLLRTAAAPAGGGTASPLTAGSITPSSTGPWTATGPTGSVHAGMSQLEALQTTQEVELPQQQERAGDAAVSVGTHVGGQLVSRSWGSQNGAIVFDNKPLKRLPGIGIIYTQATTGLPAVLQHLLVNMPVLHEITVLLTVRVITRPYNSIDERFLVRRSQQLPGVYRVIARYGYFEEVDHGLGFVQQLVGCLMRFITQQPQQQDAQGYSSTGPAVLEPGLDLCDSTSPYQTATTSTQKDVAVVGARGPAAALGKTSHHAVTIAIKPVDDGAAGDGGHNLGRWSRVPVNPADSEIVEELASAGPDLAARSVKLGRLPTTSVSPRTSVDLGRNTPGAAAGGGAPAPGCSLPGGAAAADAAAAGMVLGRESINRKQYGLQKASVKMHTPANAVVPAAAAVDPDGPSPFVSPHHAAAAAGLSPQQWNEAMVLVRCYKQRAVYIMGRSQLVPALPPIKEEEAAARSCKGLSAAGAAVRLYFKGVATGSYRLLANNTYPSSESWQLPDDQVLLVSMVVRM